MYVCVYVYVSGWGEQWLGRSTRSLRTVPVPLRNVTRIGWKMEILWADQLAKLKSATSPNLPVPNVQSLAENARAIRTSSTSCFETKPSRQNAEPAEPTARPSSTGTIRARSSRFHYRRHRSRSWSQCRRPRTHSSSFWRDLSPQSQPIKKQLLPLPIA